MISIPGAMSAALRKAKLPDVPELLGESFMFVCEHGSHTKLLCGKVTGVQYTDKAGLELFLSTPFFGGLPLQSLVHVSDYQWVARIAGSIERHQGELFTT